MKILKKHKIHFNKHFNLTRNFNGGKNSYLGSYPGEASNQRIELDFGGYFNPSTDEVGSYFELQENRYPLMTYLGIRTALVREATEYIPFGETYQELDKRYLDRKLRHFRKNIDTYNVDKYGLSEDELISTPFWIENGEFHYMEVNSIGQPLCLYRWKPKGVDPEIDMMMEYFGVSDDHQDSGRIVETTGVPRIKRSSDDEVFFFEDPLQAALFFRKTGQSSYVRPTTLMYKYNDYQKLIDGKSVVCFKNDSSDCPYNSQLKKIEMGTNNANELLEIYDMEVPESFVWGEVDDDFQAYRDNVKMNMKMCMAIFKKAKKDGLI